MSTIEPTHLSIILEGGTYEVDILGLEFDLDETYTFTFDGAHTKYTAVDCRITHWDAATGIARMTPELVVTAKLD